ncbi:winged helix-turn-helix domain-containing protein [Micromonospora sp. NPDC049089]|uniref:winged helix-turn-helix domain-containing protein n=1 Tax=Micromonospora sp. NPDC049089 TaxID=3155496 RepID=UPI0033E93811
MAEDLRDKLGAQHLPLRDQVLAALRTAIIDGDYLPGERLTEDRLAEDFGVSRNPVREALRVAEAEGLPRPRRQFRRELDVCESSR